MDSTNVQNETFSEIATGANFDQVSEDFKKSRNGWKLRKNQSEEKKSTKVPQTDAQGLRTVKLLGKPKKPQVENHLTNTQKRMINNFIGEKVPKNLKSKAKFLFDIIIQSCENSSYVSYYQASDFMLRLDEKYSTYFHCIFSNINLESQNRVSFFDWYLYKTHIYIVVTNPLMTRELISATRREYNNTVYRNSIPIEGKRDEVNLTQKGFEEIRSLCLSDICDQFLGFSFFETYEEADEYARSLTNGTIIYRRKQQNVGKDKSSFSKKNSPTNGTSPNDFNETSSGETFPDSPDNSNETSAGETFLALPNPPNEVIGTFTDEGKEISTGEHVVV